MSEEVSSESVPCAAPRSACSSLDWLILARAFNDGMSGADLRNTVFRLFLGTVGVPFAFARAPYRTLCDRSHTLVFVRFVFRGVVSMLEDPVCFLASHRCLASAVLARGNRGAESHSEILPTHALYGVSCVRARLRSVAVLGVPGHPYSWVVGLSRATEVLTLSFSG